MNIEQSFPIEAEVSAPASQNSLLVWLRKRPWFALFVIAPTMLAAIYYGLFASDVYISESRFVIKSPDQKRSQVSSLASLIQTTGLSGGQEQTNEILDFVRSRDALRTLEKSADIRSTFSPDHADIFSRFPGLLQGNSFEDLFEFYSKMVDVQLDTETGTAVITVEAFSPQDAHKINRELLEMSEGKVNRLNERLQAQGITEAEKQVNLLTERAKAARIALARFRNQQQLIDPAKQAIGVLEISNTMAAQRAALLAQLELMERNTPANPSIPALRQRIAAVSTQIASQEGRVVGGGGAIASKLTGYEDLLVEQEFATEALNVANASLAQARAEAVRQQFYLERVVEPNIPDMPLLPRRLLSILVVAASATCLYFVGWMLIVGILEHAPED